MRLKFVSVEEFYFALTLAVKTLEEIEGEALVDRMKTSLAEKFGQPSTIAPGKHNTFNYVFRVHDYDPSPASQLIISISDWQEKLRLSSDFGWILDAERKPVRTDRFEQRHEFTHQLRSHLSQTFAIEL
jgi:hypothetical protein